MKKLFIVGFLIIGGITPLHAQEVLTDQMKEKLKSQEFSVGMLVQTLGNFSFTEENFNGNEFDLGATRLAFSGTLDNNFLYKLQMDFRKNPSVVDAQVGYSFSKNFQVVAGAFKPYLSIDLDPNPGVKDFIRRAQHVSAMMNTRELGVTALGRAQNLNYRFGMYNGTGLSGSNDGKFLYTARLGYVVSEGETDLKLGLNGAINQTEMESVGKTGLTSSGDRTLYGFFIHYNSNALFSTVEFLQTRFDTPNFGDEEFITGFFITLGTHLSQKTDLLGRWDYLEYDQLNSQSELLTVGVNHQATDLIRFQVNVLTLFEESRDTQLGLSANFQFQF